jgi:benzoate membrane transport protein
MLKDCSPQSLLMGLLTAFVGFSSSFAVVLQGIKATGASDAQAASGLMALSVAMGICGIVLSAWSKMPVSIAWSTPGAAFLASTGAVGGGFSVAVGAFIVSSLLIVAAGLFRPLGRAVSAIPSALANAMLAGVLVGLCLAPVKAVAFNPWLGLPIVIAFFVTAAVNRLFAVPMALLVFVLVLVFGVPMDPAALAHVGDSLLPAPVFVWPEFSSASMISVALPLFIVTMASQNIPGISVLRVNGYAPQAGPLFAVSGLFSLLAAPFGGHAINLAAITDPKRRYWSAIIGGVFYVVLGLLAGAVTAAVALAPKVLIESVAGLALIGAFTNCITAAFKEPDLREAAAVTFMVTASSLSFGGISGAFWGLLAGGAVMGLARLVARQRSAS